MAEIKKFLVLLAISVIVLLIVIGIAIVFVSVTKKEVKSDYKASEQIYRLEGRIDSLNAINALISKKKDVLSQKNLSLNSRVASVFYLIEKNHLKSTNDVKKIDSFHALQLSNAFDSIFTVNGIN